MRKTTAPCLYTSRQQYDRMNTFGIASKPWLKPYKNHYNTLKFLELLNSYDLVSVKIISKIFMKKMTSTTESN